MTVPVACPIPAADASSVQPRKRRRRAPASGASDDCFACSKRSVKCDRRRPYCSQCLEIGSECAGYKTQLTWGVGVASRGKLRGLSLPIAKSAPAARSPPRSRPRPTPSSRRHSQSRKNGGVNDEDADVKLERDIPRAATSYTNYDFINMVPNSPHSPMHAPSSGTDWTMSISQEPLPPPSLPIPGAVEQPSHQQLLRQSLQRLHTPMMRYGDDMSLSTSAGSISGYSDNEYSPLAQSFTAEDVPYLGSPIPMYNSFSSHDSPVDHSSSYGMSVDPRGPTSCPDHFYPQSEVSSSLSSHPTIYEMGENRHLAASPAACNMSDVSYDDDTMGRMSTSHSSEHYMGTPIMTAGSWASIADEEYAGQAAAESHMQPLPTPEFFNIGLLPDISPRLSFYLNYYEKIICPITVAIDSPSNPYRHHILSLAAGSQSLQHAICALASCNLRMRRKQSLGQQLWKQPKELELQDRINRGIRSSSVPRRTSAQSLSSEGPLDDASVQEEYQHRSQAVQLLNQQLSDPSKAMHDSVLATILMLCHYRMCETGVAQFKTQFAGVKKLLGMRASGVETGNWGWMESMFTFFDAITATVNDREAQLRGGYLEMIALPVSPDHSLENLAGCDGKLFKTIATLGRLNLLSQYRPVLDPLPNVRHTPTMPAPQPRPGLAGQALVDFYKFHSHKFDGNGFVHTLDDEDLLPSSLAQDDDSRRAQFWQEWKETRHALQTWDFDPSRLLSSLSLGPNIAPSPAQIRDFGYVSEAFRYAALLYTERLANPTMSSQHLNVQNLVAQVLFYVTSLGEGSDAMGKFLLWPLFVVGAECVSDLHRGIVRGRCREIGKRGGYGNNLAGLEVLEKIWEGPEVGSAGAAGNGRSPFPWTRWMEGVEGEYIMA